MTSNTDAKKPAKEAPAKGGQAKSGEKKGPPWMNKKKS